jgi:hypothetical protein
MHDIDRTQIAYPGETESYESYESYPMASESPGLSEAEVMELASRLMEVESEEDFENFLGDIISGITGGLVSSKTGNALGGLLKGAAKTLLPIAGTAVGGYFGGPIGASLGGKLAGSVAGSLEVASEQMEWEAAKDFVRFAAEAAKNAAQAPEGQDPQAVAHQATIEAAQKHAPELIDHGPGPQGPSQPFAPEYHKHAGCSCHHRHHRGHWERHGHEIILFGV